MRTPRSGLRMRKKQAENEKVIAKKKADAQAIADAPSKKMIFRIIAAHENGLICRVCKVSYKRARNAAGIDAAKIPPGLSGVNYGAFTPVEEIVDTDEQAIVKGAKSAATGEIIKSYAVKGDTQNMGPQYGNVIVRVYTLK